MLKSLLSLGLTRLCGCTFVYSLVKVRGSRESATYMKSKYSIFGHFLMFLVNFDSFFDVFSHILAIFEKHVLIIILLIRL